MAKELMPWEEYDAAPAAAPVAPPPAQPGAAIPEEAIPVGSKDYAALPPDANPAGFYDSEGGYNAFPEGVTVEEAPSYMAAGDPSTITRPRRGVGESMWGGLQSSALMGFDDELQAAAGVAGNNIGNWLGMNESNISNADLYNILLQRQREEKDQQWEDQPWAYGAGYVPGMMLGGGAVAKLAAPGASAARVGATTGGAEGLLQGYGNAEGNFMERSPEALLSAVIGAGGGAALAPVASYAGDRISDAYGRFSRRNSPDSGLEQLSRRAPQDPAAMQQRADEWRAAGVEPRPIDVVDESGRGVVRDASSQMTPAREDVVRHADQVYTGAQDRVVDQARNNISSRDQTARELELEIMGDKNLGVPGERSTTMESAMDPIRSLPVPVTGGILQALSTREGVAALRKAQGLMLPEDKASVDGIMAGVKELAKLDPRLPPAVRDQIAAQIFKDTPLTVDIADKFARALPDNVSPGLRRVADDLANSVRGEARRLHPQYDDALNTYAAQSRVGEAAGGSGRYKGTEFLSTPADMFQRRYANADATVAAGDNGYGPAISEQDALRTRFRDEVVDRATSGGGQNAGAVAKQIAYGGGESGAGQAARNRAVLGERGAESLESAMDKEVKRVQNTDYIDPRRGSQTQSRERDALVDGFIDSTINMSSGGKWAVIRAAAKWLKQGGIRGVDAERLSRDAIDPNRTDAAIAYLADRGMSRERATRFIGAFSGALTGTAGGQTPDQPHSVRSLYQHGGR